MTDEMTNRVTNADISDRVHELEGSVSSLGTRMSVVELEQGHLRELMSSGFTAVNAKLDALQATIGKLADSKEAAHDRYDAYITRNQGRGDMLRWLAGTSVIGFLGMTAALLHTLGVF